MPRIEGTGRRPGPGNGETVAGIALAGGSGLRARPLTLTSPDYLRSKAAMTLAGHSLIDWEVGMLARQGVSRFYVVAKGRENRAQIKALLAHGEPHGVSVDYSRPRWDSQNTGSGEATLRALEHWALEGLALVFPTDSVFDFDINELIATHRAADAVVTVATVARTARESAGKYGVLQVDGPRVTAFREKPDLAEAERIALHSGSGDGLLDVNAGMYLIDCTKLRALAATPIFRRQTRVALDWGGNLLPLLVAEGFSVAAHRIGRFGDLGTPRDYLETLGDLLRGRFPLLTGRLAGDAGSGMGLGLGSGAGAGAGLDGTVRIHESSLRLADAVSGRTLAEKIAAAEVHIGPYVRIGRDVEIGPGAWIEASDVGDGVDVGAGAVLHGAACADHAIIGPGAQVRDAYVGSMAVVESAADRITVLSGYTAVGDEAVVAAGVSLDGVHVYPRVEVAPGRAIAAGTVLTHSLQPGLQMPAVPTVPTVPVVPKPRVAPHRYRLATVGEGSE